MKAGDIIYTLNGTPIYEFNMLKDLVDQLKSGDICVLHIERDGELRYVTLEID